MTTIRIDAFFIIDLTIGRQYEATWVNHQLTARIDRISGKNSCFKFYCKLIRICFLFVQISQLEEMLTHKNKIIANLENRLDKQHDYDQIKRELSFVRNELSHFGPLASGLEQNADPKSIESYLVEKSKHSLQAESLKLETPSDASHSTQQLIQKHGFFNPFSLPQFQGLGNVESFGTLLGEEIANTYAKAMAKRDPSFLAMAAAVANPNNAGKLMSANGLMNNSGNNLTGTCTMLLTHAFINTIATCLQTRSHPRKYRTVKRPSRKSLQAV